jgi:hypothetical protein
MAAFLRVASLDANTLVIAAHGDHGTLDNSPVLVLDSWLQLGLKRASFGSGLQRRPRPGRIVHGGRKTGILLTFGLPACARWLEEQIGQRTVTKKKGLRRYPAKALRFIGRNKSAPRAVFPSIE